MLALNSNHYCDLEQSCSNDLFWYSRIWTWELKFRLVTIADGQEGNFPLGLNNWRGGKGWTDNCSLHCSHEKLTHEDMKVVTRVYLAVGSQLLHCWLIFFQAGRVGLFLFKCEHTSLLYVKKVKSVKANRQVLQKSL